MTVAYQRLDLWLWYARVARQRSDCAALIAKGKIRINRQATTKPHAKVHIGDVLTLPSPRPPGVRVLRVVDLGMRRGSATDAACLFDEIEETTSQPGHSSKEE
ncbi:heat shock protein [Neoasaia chiangmaiensis NBRC 101099]|uniref:Heat-shock protein n=1 Tax=Neoasaia chiangmaiensis TaxID=320497 RepID=A0A1U9KMV2_9PROT|nr:S4 domain-containing protein [Neoasaia chiangmaiensis]AQS87122.1 heat-shock protein [Neoasaia chiangmaiensis]GBR38118.1 heat shock protein [Neoasaia chiangmaiensis NBRC 101099]GEN16040.1 RNA-binding protein [Neoasaia chiangmaiensis]